MQLRLAPLLSQALDVLCQSCNFGQSGYINPPLSERYGRVAQIVQSLRVELRYTREHPTAVTFLHVGRSSLLVMRCVSVE
jgi:hypothetical protein